MNSSIVPVLLLSGGICLIMVALSVAFFSTRRLVFSVIAILAPLFLATLLFFAKDTLFSFRLAPADNADGMKQAEGEALARSNMKIIKLKMRSTEWATKSDQVEKDVRLYIPLENESQKLVGAFLVGCRAGSKPSISSDLLLSNIYQLPDVQGVKEIAFQSPQYDMGFMLYGKITPSSDTRNLIHIQGYSGADELLGSINTISILKLFLRRLNQDKNFEFIFDFGNKELSRRISISAPLMTLEANTKLFEATAAYCLKVIPN